MTDPIVRLSDFTNHYLEAKKLAMTRFDETKQAAVRFNKIMSTNHTTESYAKENQIDISLYPVWIDVVVKPMMRDLEDRFPGVDITCSGPSGHDFTCSMLLIYKSDSETNNPFKIQFKIQLIPEIDSEHKLTFFFRDFSQPTTGEYPVGSPGYYSGANYPLVEIPNESTLEELLEQQCPGAVRFLDNLQETNQMSPS